MDSHFADPNFTVLGIEYIFIYYNTKMKGYLVLAALLGLLLHTPVHAQDLSQCDPEEVGVIRYFTFLGNVSFIQVGKSFSNGSFQGNCFLRSGVKGALTIPFDAINQAGNFATRHFLRGRK